MNTRFFVYDIRTIMEHFVASFADKVDADKFGADKFGEHAYVSDFALHEKTATRGRAKKEKR